MKRVAGFFIAVVVFLTTITTAMANETLSELDAGGGCVSKRRLY